MISRWIAGRRRAVGLLVAALLVAPVVVELAAVPETRAQPRGSQRAWLGVELDKSPGGGVLAKRVIRGSPASKAGLKDGEVIVSADGMAVDEPKQLVARVAIAGPGNAITLRVRKGTVERTVSATLQPYPGPDAALRMDKLNTFAPAWKVTTAAGNVPANVQALRGRVVVIDFWASWCGPCRLMSPTLSQWQQQYGAQGLTVLGFTTDTVPVAAQGAQTMAMKYAVGADQGEETSRAYGVGSLPTLFLIDKRGVIRELEIGFDPARNREIERTIVALLAEPAP